MPPRELNDAAPALPDHRHGHRERLRARLRAGGANALHDYELLELLLCLAVPRRDMKPLAKTMLAAFEEDLSKLLSAPRAEIMAIAGAGDAVADAIVLAATFAGRGYRPPTIERENLSSWRAAVSYCQRTMEGLATEQFRVLFLDRKNKLIRDKVMGEGTVDHAPVYTREVVRLALQVQASALILVHNHPSGDPSPSAADVEMTKQVAAAAATMDIAVHDHLIIGRGGHASLRELGLMPHR
jgi:DNA repair protein RadC